LTASGDDVRGGAVAGEKPPSFVSHLFSDRRIGAMLVLGFASGIPYQLVYITQSAWLYEAKVPLATIGLMSELTLAYKFKFVWAPFLDRYDAPFFSRLLGRRRGWIVVSQIAVMAALAGVAFGDPGQWLAWTIAFSLALGFAGATQDVVIDGWRISSAPAERQALMASWSEVGYRVGVLAAGAGALILADRAGWRAAYLCMAALMTPGMVAAFLAPEPESDKTATHPPLSFVSTVIAPIRELVARLGPLALPILVLVAGFRMPGYISSAMAVPLFKSLHYSDTDIATVTKLFGFWVGLGGTFLASYVIPRLGMTASLFVGTVAGSASHLALAFLAAHGDHGGGEFWTFAVAVSIDSFAYAFASIVLITFMSRLATTELAASQFALLTSICALPGSLLAGASGFAIERLSYEQFFIATSLIGAPVAILCWWVGRQQSAILTQAP
jgi:MFS transporter, PAT family, beta-lactamase induction signal transducer AmpG